MADLLVQKLALGTVQFGLNYGISNDTGQTSGDEIKKILSSSLVLGMDMLDTASGYGESEKMIGFYNDGQFKIVSKFPASVKSAEDLENSLKESLKSLKTEFLYGYLAHDGNTLLKFPNLWSNLQHYKNTGIISKIGYSLYYPKQLLRLLKAGFKPDIVQIPYSFGDRRFEKHFSLLKKLGCEIHVRSVFLQGLFFLPPDSLGKFFEPIKPLLRELRSRFPKDAQIASYLLNFVLNKPEIDRVVIGVNTETQLSANIQSVGKKSVPFTVEALEIHENILLPFKWPQKI